MRRLLAQAVGGCAASLLPRCMPCAADAALANAALANTALPATAACSPVPRKGDGDPRTCSAFARILRGDLPADVLDDDGELFSFVDINPASTLHYLVIPKRFIQDASMLEPGDAQLVRRMEAKARDLVRASVGEAFDERELALGFHWPPWYSVPWLHLHAIYPRSKMKRRYKYTPITFRSPLWVIARLDADGRRRHG
uniref:HIT domain-containing protein n=1 Tax=Chrysotila carterae TaxID=13221 RepID=A0A7S4EUG9_CHRCT|mmetsp:Transcript_8973/g.19456  ORF Transcript_8973/g.19456 Transcript_8973/m.19456 type:complete len:198 (+) Transcript_8973:452-1045(+)